MKHISPLSWEHINLTGIYTWDSEHALGVLITHGRSGLDANHIPLELDASGRKRHPSLPRRPQQSGLAGCDDRR
ncbi:hypothetical protein NKJ36_29880 [Mesorhizobium sp. M0142]|uniref:hypothetical protein n=1 Tax=Mesorhizobium sp. M0142 TaxID=2956894 RepID=UPI0033366086